MHKNSIMRIIVMVLGCMLLSCGENKIANSASTRWLGTYSGSGELELWNRENGSDEPNKTTHPNRSVTIDIQEGTGIDAFLSGIKLLVTYTQQDDTSKSISFPSQSINTSNQGNHLRLSLDTLNTTTHIGSLTYDLDLFRQGNGFAGKVESTEIQDNETQNNPVVWSLNFTIKTKE